MGVAYPSVGFVRAVDGRRWGYGISPLRLEDKEGLKLPLYPMILYPHIRLLHLRGMCYRVRLY